MTATIGKSRIASLIPHAGAMCLLDLVRSWDDTTIVCVASGHRDAHHPMASDGRLDAICAIEYAAQAMAVHGGLIATADRPPDAGYLASVRDVVCDVPRIDLARGDLEITATLLAGDSGGAVYDFTIRCGTASVMRGRATVVIDAARTSG